MGDSKAAVYEGREFDLNRETNTGPRKNALIVKLGQIGDAIMTIPAIHELYEQGFDIHWICGKTIQPLLECYSWINVIPVNEKQVLFGNTKERIRNIADLWGRIGFRKFDLCATLYYDRRYRLLTLPVRASRRWMLAEQEREKALIDGRHHSDEYFRMLLQREDGCQEQSIPPVRPDRLPSSRLKPKGTTRRIALVPGGARYLVREQAEARSEGQGLRRWPVDNYLWLTQRLLERGWEVVLIGGPEDTWLKAYFQNVDVTDCIAKLSLPEVVSTCDSCDCVVSNDTGPLHLAGLSTAGLIGIFGPTNPATFSPRRDFVVSIWGGQGFACRPCYDGRDFAPCRFNGCMHQVKPDSVLRELDRLLDDRSQGRPSPWRIVSPDEGSPVANEDLAILH